jgi:hypothetical protein
LFSRLSIWKSSAVTVVREPQEIERFRSAFIPFASCSGGEPPKLDQTGFVGMQTERKSGALASATSFVSAAALIHGVSPGTADERLDRQSQHNGGK